MLLEEIYFREHEYVHYLFCLYPRGFFSPSVSARPQTPFWLTADSTIMKEKVEPLILLNLSQKYYLNHQQMPTFLISLNRSSSSSAFVFQTQKVLSGTIKKWFSITRQGIPRASLSLSLSLSLHLCYVRRRGLWRVQQVRQQASQSRSMQSSLDQELLMHHDTQQTKVSLKFIRIDCLI